jgi:hypothetical protein
LCNSDSTLSETGMANGSVSQGHPPYGKYIYI